MKSRDYSTLYAHKGYHTLNLKILPMVSDDNTRIMPPQNPTWSYMTLKTMIMVADPVTKEVALKDIYAHSKSMGKAVGSIGKTQEATIRERLQDLRNIGLVEFLANEGKRGYYRLKPFTMPAESLFKKRQSRGECLVAMILEEYGISYQREKIFPDLKDKGYLRFDFYFELEGRGFVIEFDGAQHQKAIPHFGGEVAFQITQRHDAMKNDYGRSKDITVIRISVLNYEKAKTQIAEEIEKVVPGALGRLKEK